MANFLYEPLFLKYRPQSLKDVLGQSSVKETLVKAIENQKIVHAYLLTGPRGSGKTSSARILAKSLNCSNADDQKSPTVFPCGTCESCITIANSSSVDVVEIDAASHGHVEDARKLIEKVNLASIAGKYRVYIIDEVHMLTTSAFNALLKVIEEPPEKVVFILATTEVDKVPKTIASRCQQLRFKPISSNDCMERLRYVADKEQININDAALRLIVRHADGAMRDALSLLDQIGVFTEEAQVIDEKKVLELIGSIAQEELAKILQAIAKRNLTEVLELNDELLAAGKDPVSIIQGLNSFVIETLEAKNSNALEIDLSFESFELVQIADALAELEIKLKQSNNNKNLLRAALVKLCHRQDFLVVKDLLTRIEKLENGSVAPKAASAPQPSFKPANIYTAPTPTPVAAVSLSTNTSSDQQGGFLDYLSPSSRGMYISSQASLTEVSGNSALIMIPTKFKFLKSKLEQRADELKIAIAKHHSTEISILQIEISDQVPEAMPSISSRVEAPEPKKKLNEPQRNPLEGLVCAPLGSVTETDDAVELAKLDQLPNSDDYARSRMKEIIDVAINTFGAKVLS